MYLAGWIPYNAATYIYYWTSTGTSATITIPQNVSSSLKVEFLEKCITCFGTTGRRYFVYTSTLYGTESFANALLFFQYYAAC